MRSTWVKLAVVAWLAFLAIGLTVMARQDILGGLFSPAGLCGLLVLTLVLAAATGLLAGTAILCQALWPLQVARSLQRLRQFPLRCALLGVLALLTQLWLTRLLPGHGAHLLALVWVAWDGLAVAQGFPALAALCGERVGGATGPRGTALGTAVIAWGGSFPLLGWGLAATGLLQVVGTHFFWGGDRA